MSRLALAAALALAAGCVKFEKDGIYACDPATARDCLVCDARGWCEDLTPRVLGVGAINGIAGAGSDAVWTAGDGGRVMFWNGRKWTVEQLGTTETLWSIWAKSDRDVWVAGSARTFAHYDGASWTVGLVPSPQTWSPPLGSPVSVDVSDLISIAGSVSYAGVYAGDWDGSVVHHDGTDWVVAYAPVGLDPLVTWWGAYVTPSDHVFFLGDQETLLHAPPGGAFSVAHTDGQKPALNAAIGAEDDLWIAADSGLHHWNGLALAPVTAVSGAFWALCQPGPNEYFAVGNGGKVAHFSNGAWSEVAQPFQRTLVGVYCTPTQLFAASNDGTVLRRSLPLP